MNAVDRIVVVGGGQAAVQDIETLRRQGHRGAIALVAGEPHLRPALDKLADSKCPLKTVSES